MSILVLLVYFTIAGAIYDFCVNRLKKPRKQHRIHRSFKTRLAARFA